MTQEMIMAIVCRASELALKAQVSAQILAKIEQGHSTDPGLQSSPLSPHHSA
jgi:hypothetical protein